MSGRRSTSRSLALTLVFGLAMAACDTPDAGNTSDADAPPATDSIVAADPGLAPLVNPNEAGESELRALGLDSATVAAVTAGRPYASMVSLDQSLAERMDSTARADLYGRMFIPIDLNTAPRDEILLIPGVGARMAHEFEEYRPYRGIEQFRREIGKYVDEDEVARLERYVAIR